MTLVEQARLSGKLANDRLIGSVHKASRLVVLASDDTVRFQIIERRMQSETYTSVVSGISEGRTKATLLAANATIASITYCSFS